MKTSRACTGIIRFQILKNWEKHEKHHSSRAHGAVLSLETSLSLTRNMNIKVAIELYYIFSKISKFIY